MLVWLYAGRIRSIDRWAATKINSWEPPKKSRRCRRVSSRPFTARFVSLKTSMHRSEKNAVSFFTRFSTAVVLNIINKNKCKKFNLCENTQTVLHSPRDFAQVISEVFCIIDDERQRQRTQKEILWSSTKKKKCKSKLFYLENYRLQADRLIPTCTNRFDSCPQTLFEGVTRMNVFLYSNHGCFAFPPSSFTNVQHAIREQYFNERGARKVHDAGWSLR